MAFVWSGGLLIGRLLEWLRSHFVEGDRQAQEALRDDFPHEHEAYWPAVGSPAGNYPI